MSSRSATVLVIFVVACIAFCLATVFASMTGPISLLPHNDTGNSSLNISTVTDSGNSNYQTYYDNSKDYSSSKNSHSSSSDVETTTDDSSSQSDSNSHSDSSEKTPSNHEDENEGSSHTEPSKISKVNN